LNSSPAPSAVAIVAGDFVKTGGMDRANYALADYLRRIGRSVVLVAHRVAPELAGRDGVTVRTVPKPFDSYVLSEPLLDGMGRWAARAARRAGGVAIVNGGNCVAGQVNWVHYVHAAYRPALGFGAAHARRWLHGARARAKERAALGLAELVLTNSAATRRAVMELGVPPGRAVVVYLGVDATEFVPLDGEQVLRVRRELGWSSRPTVAFVGALSDRRKGFDTLLAAWQTLCRRSSWDADLVAIGAGAELESWRARVAESGLDERVRLLGFREDVACLLGACDALAAPARYEPFGLNAAEALACGLPAIVSDSAGVAELYSEELKDLLLEDPESVSELGAALLRWRETLDSQRERVRSLSNRVRARSWDHMAKDIVELMDQRFGA
jgi:glycosyltransferase involved in cell wall biosynthesis